MTFLMTGFFLRQNDGNDRNAGLLPSLQWLNKLSLLLLIIISIYYPSFMPILYINPLGKALCLKVFSPEWRILHEEMVVKNNDEFSFFPELLTKLTEEYVISEIWCVIWPWPFTLMRIITLAVNSVAYVKNIPLKSCHFFDLILSWDIPIIEANTREFLIRWATGNTEQIEKSKLPPWRYEWIFGEIDFTDGKTFIEYKENLNIVWKVFTNKSSETRITPLYYKPPHITWWKTTMLHS